MNYVVFKKTPEGERYWTGNFEGKTSENPLEDERLLKAIRFPTARSAYVSAGRYAGLWDWRVGRRVP